ncbi:MAG TPA: M28 family peptidase [Chloroflexia bacterium]|nr:M28 family peptidase [Chloroflexia bacterium]
MFTRKKSLFQRLSLLLLVIWLLNLLGVPNLEAVAATGDNLGDLQSTQGFRKAVTLEKIRSHQLALQKVAQDYGGGNRLAGTAGFDKSAEYVFNQLKAAGYNPTYQEFSYLLVSDRTPSQLQQISPFGQSYVNGVDFATMSYSGSGNVTAPVYAVDLKLPSSGDSTSGCEAADFAGFPAGAIALMQRGTCTFRVKAENARAAGASGAIIFNEGNSPDRTGLLNGTLNAPPLDYPVVGTTFALGQFLSSYLTNGPTGVTVRLKTDTLAEVRTTSNVIAETASGDPNSVIVVGAHLDSVSRGPGINDNGSGSATILEIANVFASQERPTRNKLRFIWFSAEEAGLVGSNYYVSQLSQAERNKIRLNLNFDMIGSPNYVRFVYDGDNSAFPVSGGAQPGPQGSGEIERVFVDYFKAQGFPTEPTPFNGRSDYGPFIAVGIPAGGLFSGAEGIKTAGQAATYGGSANKPYDPCYHLACDTYDNNSNEGLDQMSDAVAHAVLYFSKRNFEKQPLINPPARPGSGNSGGVGLDDPDPVAI